jgi:hypothetical protein
MAGNPRFVLYLSFLYIYIEKSEGINGGIQPTPMGLEQDFKILFRVVTPAPPGFGSGLAWSTQQASKMALFEQ